MAVEVHVAELSLMNISPDGTIYQRGSSNLSIKKVINFSTEHRVVADSSIPNTANNPSIKTYLELEAGDDFEPVQIFQSLIITKKTTVGSA
jgi:hypothetical protein